MPMAEFHVGDLVYVRPFTSANRPSGAISNMDKYSGKHYTITKIRDGWCKLKDAGEWSWKLEWLEPGVEDHGDFEPASWNDLDIFLKSEGIG